MTVNCFIYYDSERLITKFGFQGDKVTRKEFGQMKLFNTIDTWNSTTFFAML